MAGVTDFEELKVWQAARRLNRRVYEVSRAGDFSRDFGLRDQLRRASLSVVANIAEGFERGGNAEFIQFLSIAKGSAGETRALICAAFDSGYVEESTFAEMRKDASDVSRMLNGLIEYLRQSDFKGPKYRDQIRDAVEEPLGSEPPPGTVPV